MDEICTDTPECMTAEEIRHVMQEDDHLNALKAYIINGWSSTRAEIKEETQPYWPFHDDMVVVDSIVMKGRRTVVPVPLQQEALEQLHINDRGIEKMRLVARESVYIGLKLIPLFKLSLKTAQHIMNSRPHY